MSRLLPLKLVLRELRGGLKGFYILIFCLILGVGAIGAVLSLSSNLRESLRHDGRYILGGDIAFRTLYAPAPADHLKFLHDKVGPMTTVLETRAMARRADETDTALTELKAVDLFYPLYGTVELSDGAGNPIIDKVPNLLVPENDGDAWGALVEREVLERLNLSIGDDLLVGDARFTLRGIIEKEPDRVGNLRFVLAPRVMISRTVFDQTGLGGFGSQVYYDHKVLAPYATTLEDVKSLLNKIETALPDAEWRGRTFLDASPSVRRMIERLTTFLTLIGLAALLIGGVGISNAARAFLDQRLSSIATLKCLGASARLVFRVYLILILCVATVGILLGVAAGASVAFFAGKAITSELALTHIPAVYPQALFAAALFGFLTVLSFTLWLVGRAVQVSPTELFRSLVQHSHKKPRLGIIVATIICAELLALLVLATTYDRTFAMWFIFGTLATFGFFAGAAALVCSLARLCPKPRAPMMRLALSNLYRPGNVTASVILSLGLGLTVLIAVALIENNFSKLLHDELSGETPSFFFLDIQKDQHQDLQHLITDFPGAKDLRLTPSLRGRIVRVNGVAAEQALVNPDQSWVISSDRGFTYTSDQPASSRIIAGQWWEKDYSGPPIVSISTDVAQAFNIGIGAELSVLILGREFSATVANIREVDWGSFAMNFAVTFAPGLLEQAPATYLGTLTVEAERELELQRAIARHFPNVTSVRVRDALAAAGAIARGVARAVQISAGFTLLAGALVLAGGIAAAHRRRLQDAVILKVLGATRRDITAGLLIEYAILGLITVVIAAGLGTLVAYATQSYLMDDLKWSFSPAAVALVGALSLCLTLMAGIAGTWRILGLKPATMLRNH